MRVPRDLCVCFQSVFVCFGMQSRDWDYENCAFSCTFLFKLLPDDGDLDFKNGMLHCSKVHFSATL